MAGFAMSATNNRGDRIRFGSADGPTVARFATRAHMDDFIARNPNGYRVDPDTGRAVLTRIGRYTTYAINGFDEFIVIEDRSRTTRREAHRRAPELAVLATDGYTPGRVDLANEYDLREMENRGWVEDRMNGLGEYWLTDAGWAAARAAAPDVLGEELLPAAS